LHLVSAWATAQHLSLGQVAVNARVRQRHRIRYWLPESDERRCKDPMSLIRVHEFLAPASIWRM
jgi:hypothetical protein